MKSGGSTLSTLERKYGNVCRWGLRGEIKAGGGSRCLAIFDDDQRGRFDQTGEIVRNPHLPYGWRTRPVALATNVAVFTFQCTKGPHRNNLVELALRFGRGRLSETAGVARSTLRISRLRSGRRWCEHEMPKCQVISARALRDFRIQVEPVPSVSRPLKSRRSNCRRFGFDTLGPGSLLLSRWTRKNEPLPESSV